MDIPEYDEISKKANDRDDTLNPLEWFIHEHEPSLHQQEWRNQFLAAIKFIVALPKSCGVCPLYKKCHWLHDTQACKSEFFDYLNQTDIQVENPIDPCIGCKKLDRGVCILPSGNHCLRRAEDFYEA